MLRLPSLGVKPYLKAKRYSQVKSWNTQIKRDKCFVLWLMFFSRTQHHHHPLLVDTILYNQAHLNVYQQIFPLCCNSRKSYCPDQKPKIEDSIEHSPL